MSTENPNDEPAAFDPDKFSQPGEGLTGNPTPPAGGDKGDPKPPVETSPSTMPPPSDSDGEFTWEDEPEETPPAEEPPKDPKDEEEPPADPPKEPDEEDTPPAEEPPKDDPLKDENLEESADFVSFAKELGFENVKDKDQLRSELDALLKENERLKQQQTNSIQTDKTKVWEGYLKLNDEDLVRQDAKNRGLEKDDIDAVVDDLKNRNVLKATAKQMRVAVEGAIKQEQARAQQAAEQQSQQEQAKIAENRENFRKHVNGVDTMFGFKIAKDEAGVQRMRDGHFKYVTDGAFLDEILGSDEALMEASWLYRHRKKILGAAKNQGLQQGKKEVLDNIRVPDNPKAPGRSTSPPESSEFNPSKFNAVPSTTPGT